MSACRSRLILCFAFCCAMFGSALVGQTVPTNQVKRRIYVEPFVTQAGSEKFREDVIAELRKINSISLAADGHTSFDLAGTYPPTAGRRGTVEFDAPVNGSISVLGLWTSPTSFSTIPTLAK